MHMSDALISPVVGGSFWAVSAGLIAFSARKANADADEAAVPLMGILSAFVFAAQMINFSIPGTGSSGHLTGSLLLALFLGPHRGFLAVASILVLQCLFFADGGLMALGANIFNMAFFPSFVIGPLLRRYLAKGRSQACLAGAVLASALLVVELGALGVALETAASGISDLPFSALTLFMLPVHAALGAVEGLVTAGILLFILKARPDLLAWARIRPLPGDTPRTEGAAA